MGIITVGYYDDDILIDMDRTSVVSMVKCNVVLHLQKNVSFIISLRSY